MKNIFGFCAICGFNVLALTALGTAQNTDYSPATGAVISTGPNISISQAEQVAVRATDGVEPKDEQILTRTASAEALVPDIYKPFRERYYKTVELIQISWPRLVSGTNGRFGGRLALGLNRPHYRLKKELGVYGNLDLKIDGVIDGIINSARINVVYDLRRPYDTNDTRVKVFVDKVSFKIGIPIGKW